MQDNFQDVTPVQEGVSDEQGLVHALRDIAGSQ